MKEIRLWLVTSLDRKSLQKKEDDDFVVDRFFFETVVGVVLLLLLLLSSRKNPSLSLWRIRAVAVRPRNAEENGCAPLYRGFFFSVFRV